MKEMKGEGKSYPVTGNLSQYRSYPRVTTFQVSGPLSRSYIVTDRILPRSLFAYHLG